MSFKSMSGQRVGGDPEEGTLKQTGAKAVRVMDNEAFIEIKESPVMAVAMATGGWVIKVLIDFVVMGVLISGFLFLERQPTLSQTFGLTDLRLRVQAMPDAAYWSYRKWVNTKAENYSPIDTRYGYVKDFIDGQVRVHEYSKQGRVEKSYPLASIEIYDRQHRAMRQCIRERTGAETRFDIYINQQGKEHAVVWTNSGPWNVQFISQGYAYPSPNPPTNVVDAAFAEYYWNLVKGKNLDAVEIINKH